MVIDLTDDDDGDRPSPAPALPLNPHQGENHVLHNGFCIHIGDHVKAITIEDSCGAQFPKVTGIGRSAQGGKRWQPKVVVQPEHWPNNIVAPGLRSGDVEYGFHSDGLGRVELQHHAVCLSMKRPW
ncbi:hypothetical protein PG996_007528 [Apiospora saccharicola]|uniref:Uncharacterized protein n=1 Tax=Apiospora saccharicola TaxID=335842 RepID=A0ABR1VB32_9PEZI